LKFTSAFARFARTRGRGGDENDRRKLGFVTAGTMAVRKNHRHLTNFGEANLSPSAVNPLNIIHRNARFTNFNGARGNSSVAITGGRHEVLLEIGGFRKFRNGG
jgi:hypothetical protein